MAQNFCKERFADKYSIWHCCKKINEANSQCTQDSCPPNIEHPENQEKNHRIEKICHVQQISHPV